MTVGPFGLTLVFAVAGKKQLAMFLQRRACLIVIMMQIE